MTKAKKGFNAGRPVPTNTFDWGDRKLTPIQELYSKMFSKNEASGADSLRLCNAGMTDSKGTISPDCKVNSSGFSFGPVQFDLGKTKKGKDRNSIGRNAFNDIIRNATDDNGNRIFTPAQADKIINDSKYRDNENTYEAKSARDNIIKNLDKINQALTSQYGEEKIRDATIAQYNDLERTSNNIINNLSNDDIKNYLNGSLYARALIADIVNQRGPTGAKLDVKNIVNEMISANEGINDSNLLKAASHLSRAHAKQRAESILKLVNGLPTNVPSLDNLPKACCSSCHKPTINPNFNNAKSYSPPPRDPFALDLDGDGVETVNVTSGILFDHNADGVLTGTGWIKSDDGLLVRDLNGNGTIDSGRELFGDQTLLANGQLAANGFATLRDLDSNHDGVIDASDAAFSELKVWRDLNQDGISQTDELQTLEQADITSIGLTATTKNQWNNGNTIASTGSYTKNDGTTGSTADVNLAINTATTEFVDDVEVPETLIDLPDMSGSGKVRDLQQAAALSPVLADLIRQYAAATTRDAQLALIDQMLLAWADTSGMAKSLDDRDPAHYKVEYLRFGNVSRYNHLQKNVAFASVGAAVSNADNPLIDDTYRNLINSWNSKIHILEAFNGSYFFQLPGQPQEGGGATVGMWATDVNYPYYSLMPNPDSRKTLVINYEQPQLDLLDSAYRSLKQAVYESLVLQTRLKGYLDQIDLSITTDNITLDFSALTQSFQDTLAADPKNGLTDLIEFNKFTRDILAGTQWDGMAMMEDTIRSTPLTPELASLYRDLGVSLNAGVFGDNNDNIILGDATDRNIYGNNGNDILLGGVGNEIIFGGNDNDIISGGAGNDKLYGGYGDDTYIFRKGNGNDLVSDGQGSNNIFFSGLNPEDVSVSKAGYGENDEFTFTIKETGETLRVLGEWGWDGINYSYTVTSSFVFADGTVWDRDEALRQAVTKPTDADDIIIGSRVDDVITGLAGNDTIIGNKGDDIIDGGAGDDTLIGGANVSTDPSTGQLYISQSSDPNGNDTYLFGRGDGHDTIIDSDTSSNSDTLRFKDGVAPGDVGVVRANTNDLILTIKDTGDSVTIRDYFKEEGYWNPDLRANEIERIEFSDGTVWTAASIGAVLMAGTDANDVIIGYRGDDVITGGAGDDSIDARTGNDTIMGGDGNDLIRAGLGNDVIDGGAGNDTIYGSWSSFGDDIGYSKTYTDNDTYLFGFGDGHDTIIDNARGAIASNDTIRFKEGVQPEDVLFQAADNSTDLRIILGNGNDTITVKDWFQGPQNQIERFEFGDGAVLDNAWVNNNLTVLGTAGNDTLTGSYWGDILQGFDGDDTIYARNGDDTLIGGNGNDTLYGEDGNDILDGGAGEDLLVGGLGNDTYRFGRGDGHDTAFEGFDSRYCYWVNSPNDVVEFKAGVLPDDVIVRRSGNDMLLSIKGTEDLLTVKEGFNEYSQVNRIEQVRFNDGTTWDYAEMQTRALRGTDGDDVLAGGSSADLMDGGAGNDLLKGGYGSDTYLFGRGYGNDTITEEWDWGTTDTVQFTAGLVPSDLSFTADQGDLLITITDTGETLRITNGVWYNNMIERFIFSDGASLTWNDAKLLTTVPPTSESLIGTSDDDRLTGTDLDSTILGLEGNDTLAGMGGNDTIYGGSGDDALRGNAGDDTLYGEAGNDYLDGGAGRDYLDGGNGANTCLFEKGTGLDYVRARLADGQDDTILFGDGITAADLEVQLGNQLYWDIQPGDSGYATLVVGTGNDAFRIEVDGWNTDIARSSVKRFVFSDGSELTLDQIIALNDGGIVGYQRGDGSLTGSNADDTIYGGSGSDILYGRGNNDYLNGGSGNDILVGGKGDDSLNGGSGLDVYLFNRGDGNDYIENSWSSGTKTLSFGSDITTSDISAFVNEYGQLVLRVNDGIDGSLTMDWFDRASMTAYEQLPLQQVQFVDAGGNVTIFDLEALVQARLGALTNGDATHTTNLFEYAGEYDITYSAMPAGGDNAIAYAQTGDLFGAATYNASPVPSVGDDRIVGTSWGDTINGGNGNDLIYGLDGDDYLEGGAGNDRIDAGAGNDVIYGGSGNDLIMAGDGDDQIFAGPGNDIAYGGFGNDTYYFNAGDGKLTIEDDYLEVVDNGGYGGGGGDRPMFAALSMVDGGYGGDYGGTTTTVTNALQFGPGISLADLKFSTNNGYLVIDISTTGDQLRLAGYDTTRPTLTRAVDVYRFSDGSVADPNDIFAMGLTTTGTGGDDTLYGDGGNDTLIGGFGDDTLYGGYGGNDRLEGGMGNDTYLFYRGNGIDTIVDTSVPGMENRVEFGYGIDPGSLRATIEDGTFVLQLGEGDALRFEGYDPRIPGMPTPVGSFTFWDGTELSFSNLLAQGYELVGTPEQDTLRGTDGNDRIRGLAGDDLLIGGAGNDTYLFSGNDGIDTIDDLSAPGAENIVVLPEWADPGNIYLSHDAVKGELIIYEEGTNNELHLTNFDRLDPYGKRAVEYFQFGPGGMILSYNELLDWAGGFSIEGTDSADTLLGTAVEDYMYGYDGNDILQGSGGGDCLYGGSGDDTYIFNKGDGEVYISDFQEPGAGNVLQFGPDITPQDIQRHLRFEYQSGSDPDSGTSWSRGNLIIAFDNGDTIYLNGFNRDDVDNSPRSVDTFRFDDGTILSFAELVRMTFVVEGDTIDNSLIGTNLGDRLYGHEGNDTLNGGSGDDVLTGGVGDDVLIGATGRDTYAFNLGDGNDTIIDAAEAGIGNRMLFGPGIGVNDISFSLDGTTLTVSYGNQGDTVRILNFDPTGLNGGVVIDTFEFSDGFEASYSQLTNQAPVVAIPLTDQIATQDQPFSFTLPEGAFVDPEGAELNYLATVSGFETQPTWLKFDPVSRTFSGTPTNDDVGSFVVTVGVTDNLSGMVSQSFTVTVANVNDAPVVVTPLFDQSAVQDQPFSFTLPDDTFKDIDKGDQLSYAVTLADGSGLPAWLSFDASTGTLTGTPGNDQVGNLDILVTATDLAGATVSTGLSLNVANVNDAPVVLNDIANQAAVQDQPFNFQIPASAFADIDKGDQLSFVVTLGDGSALPSWLSFDSSTAILSGTPGNGQVGSLDLKVTATDLAGASVSTSLSLNVANVNDAPVVSTPLIAQNLTEDQPFSFTLPADTFKDIDKGDVLAYAITLADGSALPSWLSFDSSTATLSGTPGNDQVGSLDLKVTATDLVGATISTGLSLNVANVNDAPVVNGSIANQTATGGQLFNLAVPSTLFADIDKGDRLTITASSNDGTALPSWLTYDQATGMLSGTPAAGTVSGNFGITLTATDLAGATAATSFSIDVANAPSANHAPIVTPDSATLTEDRCPPYATGNVLANDRDPDAGDKLTVTNPGFAQGDYGYLGLSSDGKYGYLLNNASYDVQSLGRTAQVVDHFDYTVTDGTAQEASSLDITIKGTNDAPIVVHHLADQSVKNSKAFSFTMPGDSFIDIDKGDALSYTATLADGKALPSWLKFDAKTGTFSGTAPKNAGYLNIKVTATDKVAATGSTEGSLSASDTFQLSFGKRGPICDDDQIKRNDDFDWIKGHGPDERHDDRDSRRFFSSDDDHEHRYTDDRAASHPIHYLDSKQLDDYLREFDQPSPGTDRAMASRWQAVSEALERELSFFDNDFSDHRRQSGEFNFMGNSSGFGHGIADNSSLTVGSGTELKEFKGLKEGMQRLN